MHLIGSEFVFYFVEIVEIYDDAFNTQIRHIFFYQFSVPPYRE